MIRKNFANFVEKHLSLLWKNFNKIAFKIKEIEVQSHYFPNGPRISISITHRAENRCWSLNQHLLVVN